MAKSQFERDLAISRPPKPAKAKKNYGAVVTATKNTLTEYAMTVLVLLYFFSALVGGLTLLGDLVNPPEQMRNLIGALLIAFSIVALIQFVNKGVKHQLAQRQAEKE